MCEIGDSSSAVSETDYHSWPLFRKFRLTREFESAYGEIFGHSFSEQVEESADKAVSEARETSASAPAIDPPELSS